MKRLHEIALPAAFPIRICDVEISTVMEDAPREEYPLTPTIHSHPYFELFCVPEDSFDIGFTDGADIHVSAGSLCLIPPGLYHRTFGKSGTARMIPFQFYYRRSDGPQKLWRRLDEQLSGLDRPLVFEDADACRLMEDIRREMRERTLLSDEMRSSLMSQLYGRLIRHLVDTERSEAAKAYDEQDVRYSIIESFFARNYDKHTGAHELARELGLCRRQVDRVMAEIYGMSFREKLVELRMNHALRLLGSTDLPVEIIAEQVGYASPSGLYMAFVKYYGMSPGDYRRKVGGRMAESFKSET